MKLRIPIFFVCAVLAAAASVPWAQACDHDKKVSAQAARGPASNVTATVAANPSGCTSEAAAKCTPEMAAACKARGGVKASAAGNGACVSTSKSATTCAGHGMLKTAEFSGHEGCDACADMEACAEQLSANGAQIKAVPLKNGVMFVYTTDTPGRVRAIQNAMARRTEHLISLASSGDRAKLCPECKFVRGAIASGKLTRETVNIEGGCLTLMTSNDAAMVARLHAMAGTQSLARNKS